MVPRRILVLRGLDFTDVTRKCNSIAATARGCSIHERPIDMEYREGTNGRALGNYMTVAGGQPATTVALCIAACKNAGYSMAGMEYADECCMFLIVV